MIFNAPNTKKNRIAALVAIVLGLGVGFYFSVSDKSPSDESPDPVSNGSLGVSETASTPVTPTPPKTLPAARVEDIDFTAYDPDLAEHIGLEMGEVRLDSIDKIRLYFAPEPGTNMVHLTSSTFERDDGSVMLFARNDIPDDAVFAEEIFAVFSGPGDAEKFNQELAAYGLRVKCRRGENAMEWTTELCP